VARRLWWRSTQIDAFAFVYEADRGGCLHRPCQYSTAVDGSVVFSMQGIDRVFTSALDAMLAVGCRSEWILRYVWRHCRERMSMICVALQILDLPALVTLQIVDCAVQRADDLCPMAIKWRLITTVKHFHSLERRTLY
jgi:hypothetical protein